MKKTKGVYLAIGSNMGNRFFNILKSLSLLNENKDIQIIKISNIYKTKPYGVKNQNDFLNLAIYIKTKLLPYKLLNFIKKIEYKNLKREKNKRWGPRIIDIDIIFYDNIKIKKNDLMIPHKEYKIRPFVIYPLIDIVQNKYILKYIKNNKEKLKEYKYKKTILVSSCLFGKNVRFDGKNNYLGFLIKFLKKYNIKLICPEILGNLPIPRQPVEIKNGRAISKDGKNFTDNFKLGAKKSYDIAKRNNVEIVILKERSPSCGKDKIYDGSFSKRIIKNSGYTAKILEENNINVVNF